MHYGFFGEYRHSLDGKNRVMIPARFREVFKDEIPGFFATRGLDRCLFLYPPVEWEKVVATIREGGFTKQNVRTFQRLFFSKASWCELDRQGRILLPAPLLELADIRREIILVGVSERIEIWDVSNWEKYQSESQGKYEEFCSEIF